jgi:hypothetical protein
VKLYTFKVALQDDPDIWRTIEMKGNQTLDKLHEAIFQAFDRFDTHLYSFYFGKKINDISQEYTVIEPGERSKKRNAARARLDDLMLRQGRKFFYLFDFGDEWWHTIKLISIKDGEAGGKYPKIVERHGESPAQYPDYDEEDGEYEEDDEDFHSLFKEVGMDFVNPEDLPVKIPWLRKSEKLIQALADADKFGMEEFRALWQRVSKGKDHFIPLARVAFLWSLSSCFPSGPKTLFRNIMGMADMDPKIKTDLCQMIAHEKSGQLFMVHSSLDRDKWKQIPNASIEAARIFVCGPFVVQVFEEPELNNLFNVFFLAPLPDSLAQNAVRWAGEITSRVKEFVQIYAQADLGKIYPDNHHHLTLGALDLFDAHQNLFTREEAKDILESAMGNSQAQVRKKGYELAAEVLGIESIRSGLQDRTKNVRDFVKRCIDAGGRPGPKDKKKKMPSGNSGQGYLFH